MDARVLLPNEFRIEEYFGCSESFWSQLSIEVSLADRRAKLEWVAP